MRSKNIFLFLLSIFTSFSLISCGETSSQTSIPTTSETTSETTESTSNTSSLPSWIDYENLDELKLSEDYKKEDGSSKDIVADCIAQVTLKMVIDGDTAHFYNPYTTISSKSGLTNVLKARFYGVDTPESTGHIQPWGKAASNYAKEKIKNAAANGTLVVSAPKGSDGKPQTDSNERILSLIWVNETTKNCAFSDLKLLNVMLVENGYSQLKNISEYPPFEQSFLKAETQAKIYQLHVWSPDKDPNYNYGGYQETELQDLKIAVDETIKDPSYENGLDGANVSIKGTVVGYTANMLYMQKFYAAKDSSTGQDMYATVNIFTGMSALQNYQFTQIGAYVCLKGTFVYSENFGLQVSGINVAVNPDTSATGADSYVIYKKSEVEESHKEFLPHTFETSLAELDSMVSSSTNPDLSYLYSPVHITSKLVVTGGYVSDDGECTLYVSLGGANERNSTNVYVPFSYKGDTSTNSWSISQDGKTNSFKGYVFDITGIFGCYYNSTKGKYFYQIIVRSSEDMIWEAPSPVCDAASSEVKVGDSIHYSFSANFAENTTAKIASVMFRGFNKVDGESPFVADTSKGSTNGTFGTSALPTVVGVISGDGTTCYIDIIASIAGTYKCYLKVYLNAYVWSTSVLNIVISA